MPKSRENISLLPLQDRALVALRKAVEKVMQEHVRLGIPVHIWENGRVVEISASDLAAHHLSADHG